MISKIDFRQFGTTSPWSRVAAGQLLKDVRRALSLPSVLPPLRRMLWEPEFDKGVDPNLGSDRRTSFFASPSVPWAMSVGPATACPNGLSSGSLRRCRTALTYLGVQRRYPKPRVHALTIIQCEATLSMDDYARCISRTILPTRWPSSLNSRKTAYPVTAAPPPATDPADRRFVYLADYADSELHPPRAFRSSAAWPNELHVNSVYIHIWRRC